ncbi:hypothetical protein A3F08_00315 [Candidatus Berkelbacteria bacterium RIFCSPHIGHO2_12_FULL_36_9]|uniref:50S ribosomal protein L22 n=1 Tax=Candidatus Berkelbacteria bacterium RIFCSPHIGHO2_12_FULL_36_9 TaxID=1797469 RepID=A0A1F5EDL1_9BACT|nr:MAG: hypothetical protein A3F08_00315 [Candidatus Berkelbacteria bacterium RIFCSPHIGHO2_12_FULL_36_9]
MQMKVSKKFIKTSPDKIRPIVALIKKMPFESALTQVKFLNKMAAKEILEILKSGLSAAKDKDIEMENLQILEFRCDEGPRLKRRRIIHKGRATTINKRMSHLTLILSDEKNNKSEIPNPTQNKNRV